MTYMSKNEFTKMFQYIQEFRTEINDRFDATDKRFDYSQSQMDGLTKLITDYNQEMLMIAHKVDRLERWINQIAVKTGVTLEY